MHICPAEIRSMKTNNNLPNMWYGPKQSKQRSFSQPLRRVLLLIPRAMCHFAFLPVRIAWATHNTTIVHCPISSTTRNDACNNNNCERTSINVSSPETIRSINIFALGHLSLRLIYHHTSFCLSIWFWSNNEHIYTFLGAGVPTVDHLLNSGDSDTFLILSLDVLTSCDGDNVGYAEITTTTPYVT